MVKNTEFSPTSTTRSTYDREMRSSYDREMIDVGGLEIDITDDRLVRQKLSAKRIKKGECPSCGMKLYKVSFLGKKRVPMNVNGQVKEGRCLSCRPRNKPVHHHSDMFWPRPAPAAPPDAAGIPDEVLPRQNSTISAITMDHHLSVDDHSILSSQGSRSQPPTRIPSHRPEACYGDDTPDDRPQLPRRSPTQSSRPTVNEALQERNHSIITGPIPVQQQEQQQPKLPIPLEKSPPVANSHAVSVKSFRASDSAEEEAKTEITAPHVFIYPPWTNSNDEYPEKVLGDSSSLCESVGLEDDASTARRNTDPREIFFDSTEMCDLVGLEKNDMDNFPNADRSSYRDIHVDPGSLPSSDDEDNMKPAAEPKRRRKRNVVVTQKGVDAAVVVARPELNQRKWDSHHNKSAPNQRKKKPNAADVSREREIPALLGRLERDPSTLHDLTEIIWTCGPSGKKMFAASNGIEAVTTLMWADISDSSVQELAVQLLLALAASSDADPVNDVLTGERLDRAIDALLIVMQVLVENETIQEFGCRILSCLAMASSTNRDFNDGTLYGAVQTVVNALNAHRSSPGVQECGLQALCYQSTFSTNADSNKRTLVCGDSDGNDESSEASEALVLVLLALKNEVFESPVAEWACKLYWSLSQDMAPMIQPSASILDESLLLVRGLHKERGYVEMLTAAVGTIVNLVKVEENQAEIDATDIMLLALDVVRSQETDSRLVAECCCLIGNIAALSPDMDSVAEAEGIQMIVNSILAFPDDEVLFEKAIRALACLSLCSEAARDSLAEPATLISLIKFCKVHEISTDGRQMLCTILSSIFATSRSFTASLLGSFVDAVCFALRSHPESLTVQEAGSFALRNISNTDESASLFRQRDALGLVIGAMTRFEDDKTLQLNGCCILWNVNVESEGDGDEKETEIDDCQDIQCVVRVLQNHLDATDVLEMACGALGSMIYASEKRKEQLVQAGGVDAIACSFVMYPETTALLEIAGGVFSSLSSSASLCDAIAKAQGLGTVVEIMRHNESSVTVLQACALVLRNMIIHFPDCSAEAEGAVPVVMNGMASSASPDFQMEACSFLWALSASSDSGKMKILAMDGIAVLMNTLEKYSDIPFVQEAALGAFNQLALASTG